MRPHSGDIVICKVHDPDIKTPYHLSRYQGPAQIAWQTHDAARHHAEAFALAHRLDVWYTTDSLSYDRVARFRLRRRFKTAKAASSPRAVQS